MSIETLLLALLVELAVAMLKFITGLNSDLAQVYAIIIPAFFSSVFIVILAWDRLVDKPKLKLKMERKTELLDRRYSPKISALILCNLVVLYLDILTVVSTYIHTLIGTLISPIQSDQCLQD